MSDLWTHEDEEIQHSPLLDSQEFLPLSKQTKRKARHKAELPIYFLLVFLNTLIIIGIISLFIYNLKTSSEQNKNLIDEFFLLEEEESSQEETSQETSTEENSDYLEEDFSYTTDLEPLISGLGIQLFEYLIYFFILIFFTINLTYAYYRSMAIRITPWNFPEVYEMIDNYCKRLGMKTPEAYLMNSNGVMNAMSTFIVRKSYLEIDVDMFEIAYREHHDLDALGFVIAHELSHIYYRHANFWVYLSTCFSYSIPIIGSTLSRAREYSCDRLAQRITENDGIDAMLSLIAGKHLYKSVDVEDYIMQIEQVDGFFIWLYNLTASHPVMSKRIKALLQKEGSGKLF